MKKQDFFCAPRISRKALSEMLSFFECGKNELHTLEIYDRDGLAVRLAPAPYSCTDKREVYSLSKSFCSSAIGLLVTDGVLSVNDRIVDLFPDRCPDEISENLANMRLSHVLSMNTGHPACVMDKMIHAEDPVRAFLSQPVPFVPGTHFAYNTGATCLLSCIVTEKTGMTLLDFLTARLFMPLGIEGIRWNRINAGQNEGGCGAYISCDDIAKLGLLYLHDGVWNGTRLLSHEWVAAASSPVSDNSGNGTPDWCSGYGYQFWINARGGFRGDGAAGQYCLILPEKEIVIAVQTMVYNMQGEMDALIGFSDHMYDPDTGSAVILPEYPPLPCTGRLCGFENRFYKLDPNPMGFTGAYLTYDPIEDACRLVLSNGIDQQTISAGAGHFFESSVYAKHFKPKLLRLMPHDDTELCRMAASYSAEPGKVTFLIRYLNSPQTMRMEIIVNENTFCLDIIEGGYLEPESKKLTGVRI